MLGKIKLSYPRAEAAYSNKVETKYNVLNINCFLDINKEKKFK